MSDSDTHETVLGVTGNSGHGKRFQPQITQMHADNHGLLKRGLAHFETLLRGLSAAICVIYG